MVSISVADRGPGIDDLDSPWCSRSFIAAATSAIASRHGDGTRHLKAIVEAHGGTIGLTSQIGSGSVFHFTVPGA